MCLDATAYRASVAALSLSSGLNAAARFTGDSSNAPELNSWSTFAFHRSHASQSFDEAHPPSASTQFVIVVPTAKPNVVANMIV